MIGFVLVAAAMVIAAIAVIAVPLLRSLSGSQDRSATVVLLRDQLAELETDLDRGVLGAEHYQAARDDLERRVLEEARDNEPVAPAAVPAARSLAVVLGILIPLGAVFLYAGVGNPGALRGNVAIGAGAAPLNAEQAEAMVNTLAIRLERDAGNLEGWTLLARSYHVLRQYENSASAYERAVELAPGDASLLAGHADALVMLQGGSVSGKPLALIERALAIDPDNAKALALAGRNAFDHQDYKAAAVYWERLRAAVPANSASRSAIEAGIAAARARAAQSSAAPAQTEP